MAKNVYEKLISAHLDIRTFELRLQHSISAVTSNMESVSMAISNQYVTSIRDINSIRETRDLFTANATLELTSFIEHSNAMAFEVTHIEVIAY